MPIPGNPSAARPRGLVAPVTSRHMGAWAINHMNPEAAKHLPPSVLGAFNNAGDPPGERRGAHAAIEDLRRQREEDFAQLGQAVIAQGKAIDELNAQLASARLGGAPGAPSAATGRPGQMPDAIASAMGDFLKSGKPNAAMHTEANPDGGFTVTPQIASTITQRLFSVSPIRQVARIVPLTTSDTWEELNDRTEAEALWAGEREAREDTDNPQLGKLSIVAHEMYAQPKATQKLLEDSSINVAEWLIQKVSSRFSRKEGAAFVSGDGVGKPRGFLTYDTASADDESRAWGTMQYVPSGDASGFVAATTTALPGDCLADLVYSLKAEYWPGAVFLMNRKTAAVVRKWKDAEGRWLWSDSLVAGQPPTLMGFPVVFAEDMPNIGANAFPIAFGNFAEGYTIVDRLGVTVLRDPYSNKPYVRFYTRKRVGGAVHNSDAIKLLKIAAT
jgi:HK97 family phage major capsid protein